MKLHALSWDLFLTRKRATTNEQYCLLMSSGNAGSNENSEVTPLALPASLGGHQSHIAAALASSQQHLEQQMQLHAALQVDISSIGKQQLCSLTRHVDSPKTANIPVC